MSYISDVGTNAAVPDVDRVLTILDSAFVGDTMPTEDIISTSTQPALVSGDGDELFEQGAISTEGEWHVEEALNSAHIIEVMLEETAALELASALKDVDKPSVEAAKQ